MANICEWSSLATPKSRLLIFSIGFMVLFLWPTSQLEWLPVRSIWAQFGFEPYSTGITRSLSMIAHGDFGGAWMMNPLGYAVMMVVAILSLKDLAFVLRKLDLNFR